MTPQYEALMTGTHWVDRKGHRWDLRDMTYNHLINLLGYLDRHDVMYQGQHIQAITKQRAEAALYGLEAEAAYGELLNKAIHQGPHTFMTNTPLWGALRKEVDHRHRLAQRKNRLERKRVKTRTWELQSIAIRNGDSVRFEHDYYQS